RLPPGQYLERGFPVLSAGPTPHTPLERWDFSIGGTVKEPKRWTWEELLALPHETPTVDISCVTKWTKFDTHWEGVSVETLLQQVDYDPNVARYVIAFSDGDYTTNLPLADVLGGKRGWPSATTASPWRPSTAARPACWCPISISGRAPSGSGVCGWSSRMTRVSGSRWATTIMGIHGKNSATGATELATG